MKKPDAGGFDQVPITVRRSALTVPVNVIVELPQVSVPVIEFPETVRVNGAERGDPISKPKYALQLPDQFITGIDVWVKLTVWVRVGVRVKMGVKVLLAVGIIVVVAVGNKVLVGVRVASGKVDDGCRLTGVSVMI